MDFGKLFYHLFSCAWLVYTIITSIYIASIFASKEV